jgi:tetratricopeptide (TPR) repeat protein
VVDACDGVAIAIEEAVRLGRTMRPDRLATQIADEGLDAVMSAIEQAIGPDSDPASLLLWVGWLPTAFDSADCVQPGVVDERTAATMLAELLDRGLIRPTRDRSTRFRVPRPIRAAARRIDQGRSVVAAGTFVAETAARAQRALWGPRGATALATLRAIAADAGALLTELMGRGELALVARILGSLTAEPFAQLPCPADLAGSLRDAPLDQYGLAVRCAIVLSDAVRRRGDAEALLSLARDAEAAGDERILVLTMGQAELLAVERDVALPQSLRLEALIERLSDSSLVAFARVRLASVLLGTGRSKQARRQLESARAAIDQHQIVLLDGYARNRLAQCWFLEGHAEQARAGFEDALRRQQQAGQIEPAIRSRIDLAGTLVELGETDEALSTLDEAVEAARAAGADRLRLGALLLRGMTHRADGRLALAELDMQTVSGLAGRLDELRTGAVAAAYLAEFHVERGDWAGAAERIEPALRCIVTLDSVYLELFVSMLALPIELVHGGDVSGFVARMRALMEKGDFPFAESAVDALDALRLAWPSADRASVDDALAELGDTTEDELVGRMIEHAWAARSRHREAALVIHPEGLWFEARDGVVDLRRRRAPRLLLVALARARDAGAGVLTMEELFESAWQSESATPDSAAQRVYTAVWTLRKMGLEEWLEKRPEGYLLSEELRIVWSDDLSPVAS